MGIYYLMGQLYASHDVYLGVPVNIMLACLCVALILLRKQKIDTIGFTRKNAFKAMVLGLTLGSFIVIGSIVLNTFWGHQFAKIELIMANFVYYMLIISLVEEILFRGYLQTRLYGLVKKPLFAVVLGGILFMLMHIPFQMGYAKMGLLAYVQENYITLSFTFIWHLVFDFLYRKYNSIYAPTIFHGLLNWSNYLF